MDRQPSPPVDIGGLCYGAPEFDKDGLSGRRTFDAGDVSLTDFALDVEAPVLIFYEYDFGDCWTHAVSLVLAQREAEIKYPRCTKGSRSGPPEDVGGPLGYADFLKAWQDAPVAGRKLDPERFDPDTVNRAITRAIRRSRGNYRFRHEA